MVHCTVHVAIIITNNTAYDSVLSELLLMALYSANMFFTGNWSLIAGSVLDIQ